MLLTKSIVDIFQGLVIIFVTAFTAWWTYKTFAHREKVQELKELKNEIELYSQRLVPFLLQVRDSETPDDQERKEKLELADLHNELRRLSSISLYTKPEVREQIQNIVGYWIANDRRKAMRQSKSSKGSREKEREAAWQKFNNEYEEVTKLIDEEADKYIFRFRKFRTLTKKV